MIYNFRRNAFRVDDHGNYVHDVKFPIIWRFFVSLSDTEKV
jgi:hypothetical protein